MPFWPAEPLLQRWRIKKILPYFPYGGVHLDIGCDTPPVLINLVKERMKQCIGVDIAVKPEKRDNVEIKRMDLQKKIDLDSNYVNVITLLAVLEHMKYPVEILKECYRILKPGGIILITVPSPQNEPILHMFAALHLVRPEMIDQHETYFTKAYLLECLNQVGYKQAEVRYFELTLNTFAMAKK